MSSKPVSGWHRGVLDHLVLKAGPNDISQQQGFMVRQLLDHANNGMVTDHNTVKERRASNQTTAGAGIHWRKWRPTHSYKATSSMFLIMERTAIISINTIIVWLECVNMTHTQRETGAYKQPLHL